MPPSFVLFLKSAGWRTLGAVLILTALAAVLSLISYNPADPTVNNQSYAHVSNWLGFIGANVADVLMQVLAYAAYLLVLPVFLWGFKLIRLKWLPMFWLNLAMVPVGVILLAVAMSVVAPGHDFPVQSGYGGALGQELYQLVISLMAALPIIVPNWAYGIVFAVLGLPIYAFSFALNKQEWAAVWRFVVRVATAIWRGLVTAARMLVAGIVRFIGLFGRKPAPALDEDEEDARTEPVMTRSSRKTAEPEKANPVVAKRVKTPAKPKRGTREVQEAQALLDFGDVGDFSLPPLDLLAPPPPADKLGRISEEALEQNARMLEGVLDDFGVQGEIRDVRPGPVVTLYELEPARGTKSARVIGLADDIARSMSAVSARVAVVPGRNAIGIELPNVDRQTVFLRELLASRDYEATKARLAIVLGKDIGGAPVVADLAAMPHLLVAGTTGSGKSVGVNTMILSLLYRHSPESLRLIMVDPKMLELSIYDGIPHLLTPVVTEAKKAVVALKWAVREMEERYRSMSKLGVRNLAAFNKRIQEAKANGERLSRQVQTGFDKDTGQPVMEEQEFDFQPLPFIVIVIDEMADLMLVAGKDVEATIQRLAQMARAAGIHMITATQRPSVDVITGTIKANFPTRISFQVTSKIDSRTILGEQGAEQLLGMGDMLFMAGGGRITRVHGAFVSDNEVERIVNHLKKQGAPEYLQAVTEEPEEGFDSPFIPGPSGGGDDSDSLYDKAVDVVLRDRRASTSYIQRRLKIGYNKAASLIEEMEEQGVISAPNHKGQREVLVPEREEEF
ncbi:DNA translocase FtsK [Kordiimonas marina]|uniref:DNA translocase FtsK n=1 Tax=Kordiimonas marina TaxID=2872312 RepID=UPI001FF65279|nr:DNA translocase FtsK [Kordiimonas marina]MCJ9429842.1 DNA translocase FtsK 4TM domain-containing protein [Kordiimonas marina]